MDIEIQQWLLMQLGAGTDLVDLQERYDRLGSARAVALEVLYTRRATLISQPASVTVPSVVGVSYAENIKAIERQIAQVESGDPPAPGEPGWGLPPGSDTTLTFVQLIERPRR